MSEDQRRLPVIQSGGDETATPIFERVAVIGLGLIGGSVALAARQTWPKGLVIGVDNKEVLERAMVQHAIDVAAADLEVVSGADLVVLAAPVQENMRLVDELEQFISGPAIITDVGSTKRDIVSCAGRLPDRFTFIGGHPLGGAPQSGIAYARSDLFVGRPWLFTPTSDSPAAAVSRLKEFVSSMGATPHVMTANEHDNLLAYLSHLPQLTASALMHVVGTKAGAEGLGLTGRGLHDTTRLASSPPTIWRDICTTNEDEIRGALDSLIKELSSLRDELGTGNAIESLFESAAKWRSRLPRQTRSRET